MPKVKLLLEYEWEDISEQLEEENQTLEEYIKYKLSERGRKAEEEAFYQSDAVFSDMIVSGFKIENEGEVKTYLYKNIES